MAFASKLKAKKLRLTARITIRAQLDIAVSFFERETKNGAPSYDSGRAGGNRRCAV
jgi:hypothetical protein